MGIERLKRLERFELLVVKAMKSSGAVREYAAAAAPLLGLIQQLAAQSERRSIDIQCADLKLRLRRL